jgi:unsaturated rhamnogalacturonyl hydrolase
MDGAPAAGKLAKASVYIIVDPDFEKENPSPSFMNKKDADVIYQYVVNGGVLVLMANDSGNVEFKHFNQLAGRFGIKFNENLRHDVKGREFEQGAVVFDKKNPIFKTTSKAYIKQLCSQTIQKPASPIYSENGETLISVAKVGKGTVFAVGDPWLYNEYVDGRKLPAAFENYNAAEDLVKWLLKQSTR